VGDGQREQHGGHQPARDGQVGGGQAHGVAEEQVLQARGRARHQREQGPQPQQRGDHHGHAHLRVDAPVARGQEHQRRGPQHPAARAHHQRRAGQRGQRQAGEHGVGQRLGGVGVAQVHDPHPQCAAGGPHEHQLHQRALEQGGVQESPHAW